MQTGKNNKIDEILNSLDGANPASAPDFFYTRLKAKIEGASRQKSSSWMLRPAYALTALVVVLIVNITLLIRNQEQEDRSPLADTEKFQSIASDYSLNDNSAYELIQEK